MQISHKLKLSNILILVALTLSATILCSCEDEDDDSYGSKVVNKNANKVVNDVTVARLEMPRLNEEYDYICHKLSDGQINFSLEYDKEKYQARWVAYVYDTRSAQRNWTSRTEAWAPEPFYDNDKKYQVTTSTFPNGYARGHICGSAERYYSQEANEQTFYMSNMTPMNQNFNKTYWGEIEDKVRDKWGRTVVDSKSEFYGGTLYVVKGGTLEKVKGGVQDPTLPAITVKNTQGQQVKMTVPKYFWIACLFVSKSGGCRCIGFKMQHKDYQDSSKAFLQKLRRESACSIDELEAFTGIDFFCNLSDEVENDIESKYNINLWPGI